MDNFISVWVVDDEQELCISLERLLNLTSTIRCPHTFPSCESALQALEFGLTPPDVILLDIGLKGMSGLDGILHFKRFAPASQIIILTVHDADENILRAIKAGARGYLLKWAGEERIVQAIHDARKGGVPMDPIVVKRVVDLADFPPSPPIDYGLTQRETEMIGLLRDGLTMKEIAEKLSVSFSTVNTYCDSIHKKLGVHTHGELLAKIFKERLT